ncbi:MAG: polyprenyl synthetase family protein [Paracoccaceae bacterium]
MREVAVEMRAGRNNAAADAVDYHLDAGGSRTRARFAIAAGDALGLPGPARRAVGACCELLHNASLVHDDLQDGCVIRRQRESVAARFGRDVALCAGDLLISSAYAAIAPALALIGPEALTLIHRAVAQTIYGQIADRNGVGPADGFADYERVAADKSGPLLALPLELCLLAARKPVTLPAARRAGLAFGVAYQIADDIADVDEDARAGTVNAVLQLERSRGLSRDAARAVAARIATAHLAEASEAASSLPRNAGLPLTEAAAALSDTLQEN